MAHGGLAPRPRRLGENGTVTQRFLAAIKAGMGDAFSQEDESIIGAENIAWARLFTLAHWQAEKLVNNSLPATSFDLLLDWATRLGVSFRPTDSIASIRKACVAKYMATGGSTQTNIQDTVSTLLAGSLIDITYFYSGDLSAPPDQTYWAKNPAPNSFGDLGLGDGTWTSLRCHILVAVQQASGQGFNDLMYLVCVQLYNLLDVMLPAWATFDFTLNEYDGFWLNDFHNSLLGYTAL